jgi:hypothetical protein
MHTGFMAWLEGKSILDTTAAAYVSGVIRIEDHYGDLLPVFKQDGFKSLIASFKYSRADELRNRSNPTRLPIFGNIRQGLALYRSRLYSYGRFLSETIGGTPPAPQRKRRSEQDSRLDQSWLRPRPPARANLGKNSATHAWFSQHDLTLDEFVRIDIPMKTVSKATAFARRVLDGRRTLSAQVVKAYSLDQGSKGDESASGSLLMLKAPARQIRAVIDLLREAHPEIVERVSITPMVVPRMEPDPLSS